MLQLITTSRPKVQISYSADIWRTRCCVSWCIQGTDFLLVPCTFPGAILGTGAKCPFQTSPTWKEWKQPKRTWRDSWRWGKGWELKTKARLKTFISTAVLAFFWIMDSFETQEGCGPSTQEDIHRAQATWKKLSHSGETSHLSLSTSRKPYGYDMNVKFICLFFSREGWASELHVEAALFEPGCSQDGPSSCLPAAGLGSVTFIANSCLQQVANDTNFLWK